MPPSHRPVDRLDLPRVHGARVRLGRSGGVRRRRGDGRHRRAEPADRRGPAAVGPPRACRSARSTPPACSSPSGCGAPSRGASSSAPRRWPRRWAPSVVVVHPPFRWQREYAAGLRRRHRRARGVHRHRLRGREHVPLAGRRPAPDGDVPPRLGPLRTRPYANATIDLSHAAIAHSDVIEMARAARAAAAPHPPDRRQRLGQGRAPGAWSRRRWVPTAFLRLPGRAGLRRAASCSEINTRRCDTAAERERDLVESLEFAREHFAVRTP